MSQGRSIIDIIQDPAALESFLRSSAKSSTNPPGPQRISTTTTASDPSRLTNNLHSAGGNNIYNQNTTNNTNVQITQNTYNFNTNPSLSTTTTTNASTPSSQLATNETTHVLNQTIGSQTNVNVILNQTVIQQQQPSVQTTTAANQQQMVAININGNQTLIPLSMFTKLLQQKNATAQQSTTTTTPTNNTTVTNVHPQTTPQSILQNGSTQNPSGSIFLQNSSPVGTTVRFVRPPATTTTNPTTSNITMMTSGQRVSAPVVSKPATGNIIVQVTNNDGLQPKLPGSSLSTNSDLTTQLMNDLQVNSKDPEKQIALIDTYLSRMHSSTEKDLEFSKRIIRYRETLSHSVEQARIDGQHRQRLLYQNNTLNTLSSNPSIKREVLPLSSQLQPQSAAVIAAVSAPQTQSQPSQQQQQQQQQKSNETTLIQLPLAKQDELLNAVLKKLRHVNLPDLQAQGILPMELTFEQKLQIQKLDMQIAALPIDKQQQFARGQRELVPKYLAKNAASGLNTTTTLTVNHRTKILLGAPPGSTATLTAASANTTRSLRISSADLIGQQLRKDQAYVLKPDFKSRFLTRGDAIKRLTRYHVFTKPAPPAYEPTEDECRQFDDSFEIEAKRLLTVSERINQSISRFTICNDQLNNESYDKYLFEKMRLDDLREQLEIDKANYESRKRRALDVENRPVPMSTVDDLASSPLPSSTFDFLSNSSNFQLAATMSDAEYDDLFNSDPISKDTVRTSDETQLAINSIVDCGALDQHLNPPVHMSDSTSFFFDELDLDNHPQDNNPSQDDEASRAVQNLLGFS